jgi:uncharacterized lipoprotein
MKHWLFAAALLALLSGCSVVSSPSTVVNLIDWSTPAEASASRPPPSVVASSP